ncbi:hypothetical protein N9850_00505 [Granulosicoccus sp.]|nr:hypothetical protein [Granulosicoccus sp.]MDB4222223.1 hypothetical protein [Granulosicoccus sp.]
MKKWLLLLGSLLVSGHLQADIRVLFRFDVSGHFVHRIYQVASRERLTAAKISPSVNSNKAAKPAMVLSVSPIDRGRSWKNAVISEERRKQAEVVDGFARLVWFDTSGIELTQTEVPDPRIVHSPSHAEGFNASRSGLTAGAWLASGPETAFRVTVFLPESTVLGLAAEFWSLDLVH